MNLILIETALVKKFYLGLSIIALQWKQPKKAQPRMAGPLSDFSQVVGNFESEQFLLHSYSEFLLTDPILIN